jgi:hypothetical protein
MGRWAPLSHNTNKQHTGIGRYSYYKLGWTFLQGTHLCVCNFHIFWLRFVRVSCSAWRQTNPKNKSDNYALFFLCTCTCSYHSPRRGIEPYKKSGLFLKQQKNKKNKRKLVIDDRGVCVCVCNVRPFPPLWNIFFLSQITVHDAPPSTHTEKIKGRATHRPAAGDNVYTSVCIYRREREKNKYTSSKELGLFRRESVTELWPRKRIIWGRPPPTISGRKQKKEYYNTSGEMLQ